MHAQFFDVSVEITEPSANREGDDEIDDAENECEPCLGNDALQSVEYNVGDGLYFFEIRCNVFLNEGEVRQVVAKEIV